MSARAPNETCRTPEAARNERNERKRSRARRAFDTARMSPASVPRRGTAQAPASASESRGNRAGREVAAAAGAVAVLAALAAATRNATSNRARRASPPPRRVSVAVQPRPGGIIAFEASAPVVAAEHAWPAARAAALGELAPGAQLSDVQSVEVLERKKNVAVVRQDASWRVGPASGVARVTVRARVDDASQTAAFELVGGCLDAFSSSSSSSHAVETETTNARGSPGCFTQKKKKKKTRAGARSRGIRRRPRRRERRGVHARRRRRRARGWHRTRTRDAIRRARFAGTNNALRRGRRRRRRRARQSERLINRFAYTF